MKPQPRYQPGDRIGGRYHVHKALLGGMGEVYLCLDLEEMNPYALKTFQQRYLKDTQRLRHSFEQEVATWIALERHPNIVHCSWMEIFNNQPFMGLEWIIGEQGRGADLRSWLGRGPLKMKLVLEIASDICRGLKHAREKQPGLVHRDLKPENILIAQGGLAKITDFGLAQFVKGAGLQPYTVGSATDWHQSFVSRNSIAGTPAYMAPEQWRGEMLDERTDIYALGCVLYEMLTGTRPFNVDFTPTTPQQMQAWLQTLQTAHESCARPKLPATLPASLDKLVQNCLAKTLTARPGSLAELFNQIAEIYQLQFNQPIPSRPTPNSLNVTELNNRGNTGVVQN